MSQGRAGTNAEDDGEGNFSREIKPYNYDMVDKAIQCVVKFQQEKVGMGFCVNSKNQKCNCSCLWKLSKMKNRDEYYTACEEMAMWFEEMNCLEEARDNGDTDQSTLNDEWAKCVFLKSTYGERSFFPMVNMSTTNGIPIERSRALRVTGWKGHDWDTTDDLTFHSALCLQSMIRVWRSMQITEDVKTLRLAMIESVAISVGNKETADLKKKNTNKCSTVVCWILWTQKAKRRG